MPRRYREQVPPLSISNHRPMAEASQDLKGFDGRHGRFSGLADGEDLLSDENRQQQGHQHPDED